MKREQRGARGNCSGTIDNFLNDRIVCEEAQRGKRNLSMACVDVANVYDPVDHRWLSDMFTLHRFPIWFGKVIEKLASWNRRDRQRYSACLGSSVEEVQVRGE